MSGYYCHDTIPLSVQCDTDIIFYPSLVPVYQVEVTTQTGHYYRVERRYSAFHSLNKQAKKLGLGPLSEFPPKRIRNTSAKVLESRRKGLEHFIQSLARVQPVPQLLLSFLELPASLYSVTSVVTEVGVRESGDGERSYTTPVIGYPEDPYLAESDESNDMSSMITEGNIGNMISCSIDPNSYHSFSATLVAFYK